MLLLAGRDFYDDNAFVTNIWRLSNIEWTQEGDLQQVACSQTFKLHYLISYFTINFRKLLMDQQYYMKEVFTSFLEKMKIAFEQSRGST